MNFKVAAVVVTFNRKALLLECLNALLKQTYAVDLIYLIDNASTDETPVALAEAGYIGHPNIEYVRLPENVGGAGGFYAGIKLAHQGAFDWVWVMDDDAEPLPDALSNLFSAKPLEVINKCSAICGKVVGLDGLPQYLHRGNFDPIIGQCPLSENDALAEQIVSYASFVGLLIRSLAINQAGYPIPEFFIWSDDFEYCQRLNNVGPIFYNPHSVILHKDDILNPAEKLQSCYIKTHKRAPLAGQWKSLCGFRNFTYVMRTHGSWGWYKCCQVLAKRLIHVILFEEGGGFLAKIYIAYWLQGVGLKPFKTIKPAEWVRLINR